MERIGLEPGSEIGGYTVVAPLGSGGMGTVYRAVDGGGDAVALKLLHPHVGSDAATRDRLRREVPPCRSSSTPAWPRCWTPRPTPRRRSSSPSSWRATTSRSTCASAARSTPSELLDLAEGLRDTLVAVHGAGVVHRDLKPSNVIIGDDGPVLIDFGLAQAADDSGLTSDGLVLGTPGYLAPELLDGAEPDAASDFWGWAAVLVFAATGRPPFGAGPLEAVLARARSGDVDLDGLGPLTATALRRALVPDAADRTVPGRRRRGADARRRGGRAGRRRDGDHRADRRRRGRDHGAGPPSRATVAVAPVVAAAAVAPVVGRQRRAHAGVRPVPRSTTPEDEDWDEDPEGVDWIEEDLDASEEPEPEGSGLRAPAGAAALGHAARGRAAAGLGRRAVPGRRARRCS